MTEAERDRAAVVEWLFDDAAKTRADLTKLHANKRLTPSQTKEWEMLITLKVGIAQAIERGEHIKDKTP